MEHGGQQLTGDLIHVGDHQQQALGRGERGGQRAGSQGAVHGAGGARLGLHLNNFHFGAEDVLLVQGGPLVHLVGHGARRGDGVDAGNFGKRIGYMSRSGVAVHRFLGSWHFSSSGSFFIPPRRQMIPGGGGVSRNRRFAGASFLHYARHYCSKVLRESKQGAGDFYGEPRPFLQKNPTFTPPCASFYTDFTPRI